MSILRRLRPVSAAFLPAPAVPAATGSEDIRTRMLSELNGADPEELEKLAGKLLVLSAKRRLSRLNPGDRHEVRHIEAALLAGSTDDEAADSCALDSVQWQDFEVIRDRQVRAWRVRLRRAEREAANG